MKDSAQAQTADCLRGTDKESVRTTVSPTGVIKLIPPLRAWEIEMHDSVLTVLGKSGREAAGIFLIFSLFFNEKMYFDQ